MAKNFTSRIAVLLLLCASMGLVVAHRRRSLLEDANDLNEAGDYGESEVGGRLSYKIQNAVEVKGIEEDTLANYDIPVQEEDD